MDVSFAAPISGMRTSLTRQDVTANNVANVNTPGFEERTVHQADMVPQGVRVSGITRTPNDSVELSNTDLAKQSVDQMVNRDTLTANTKVIKAKDRMIGTLLDMMA
jgi:flagellar hook protein FlgE